MAHTQCIECDGCGTHQKIPNDWFLRDEPLKELPNHWAYLRVHEDPSRHNYRAYCEECIIRGRLTADTLRLMKEAAATPTQGV